MKHKLREFLECSLGAELQMWTEATGIAELVPDKLPEAVTYLRQNTPGDIVFLTHVVNDERELGRGFVVYLVLNLPGDFTLTMVAHGIERDLPSLTTVYPALNWAEREGQDLYGLCFSGHPDSRPLVLHPGWPEGFYPLRKDCHGLEEQKGASEFVPQPLTMAKAEGEGLFEVPVGPIHAGIIEPGHFRFQTVGEIVLHLDAQLFYTHRGIEKLLEGLDVWEALPIIERVCGVCAVSHALAYCEAVEKIAGIAQDLPWEVSAWRTILAELERLYNHIGDIGNMCAGVGFALGTANGLHSKERLQALNKKFFGHRFLRGVVIPGGLRIAPDSEEVTALCEALAEAAADFAAWIPLVLEHDGFRQRAVSTGIVTRGQALDLGTTGPTARASGVAIDWRQRHTHLLYGELGVEPECEVDGDVWARLMVRVRETRDSFRLVERLLNELGTRGSILNERKSNLRAHNPVLLDVLSDSKQFIVPAWRTAWGCVESPRGTDVIWLMTDGEGKIYRCRIRSASYANWPAVPLAAVGDIVPDFPLINKSFELCYSCCDR